MTDGKPITSNPAERLRPTIAALLAAPVVAVAVLAMLGWLLRIPWMVQIIPGSTAMVFLNALCLLLLGAALILATVPLRWCKSAQTVIGIGVALIGVTVMVQYRFDLALPLDLAEIHSWLNGNPGRMAPNTALAHTLAGLTVLLTTFARPGLRAVPAIIGAFSVVTLGVTGLIGYRVRPELLYGWHLETRMALHTAAAFVLLGIGFAVAVYRNQRLSALFHQREDWRVGLLAAGLMITVGLVSGLVTFSLLQRQTESVLQNSMQLSFESRHDLLATEIPIFLEATRDFAERPGIQRELMQLQATPGNRSALMFIEHELVRHTDSGSASGKIYDASERLLASVGPVPARTVEIPLPTAPGATLIWDGQAVYLHTMAVIRMKGVTLGRVEIEYGMPDVTRMISHADETHQSSEIQLCALHQDAIRCLPTRHTPQLTELPAATRTGPTIIARAVAGQRGLGFKTDYRGERVIAAYGPVGETGLGMVLQIDVAEIYGPLRAQLELALLITALIIGAGMILLRARLVPLVRRLALSERRFRGLLEAAPDAMLVANLDGRIVWANRQSERLFGYSLAELIGQPVELLVPENLRDKHMLQRQHYADQPHVRDVGTPLELRGRRKDGSEFPAEIGLSPQDTEDGIRIIGTVRDISERQRAIQALRDSEQRWQFALEGARDGVWDWDLTTNAVFFSRQWKTMLGYADNEIAHSLEEWDKRVHPDDKARAYADIQKHLDGKTEQYENEHRLLCKDGTYKWILDRGMVVSRDANGKPTRLIGTHTDITERKQSEETIREMSLADELTGLRNRRGFMVLGESQLNLARRMDRVAVLYFADVDGLKRINDELGHVEGDQALRDFADILRTTFRETDLIARLGGDEFVVLALEAPGIDASGSTVRLEENLQQFNDTKQRPFQLEASIGMALHGPEIQETLTELLRRADAGMYEVKIRRRAARTQARAKSRSSDGEPVKKLYE